MFLFLPACATQRFTAGAQKNSLPVADRPHLEEVHSIAVAPFYRDDHHWRQLAQQTLGGARTALVPLGKVDAAFRSEKKDPRELAPGLRPEVLARIGRSLRADAVLNGMVLLRGERRELVLQLISSRDSRILFWQAADFSFTGEGPEAVAQKGLLSRMLEPVVAQAGTRREPAALPPVRETETSESETGHETTTVHEKEDGHSMEKKQKTDGGREKEPNPPIAPEEISPM